MIRFVNYYYFNNNIYFKTKIYLGDWGLGIGDWGLGIGPNPQSPNPHSPTPNHIFKYKFKSLTSKGILLFP